MPDVTDIPTQEETPDTPVDLSTEFVEDDEELIDPTLEPDEEEPSDEDIEEDSKPVKERGKGDLKVALQKEREKRKELEQKLAQTNQGSGLTAADVRNVMRMEKALETFPMLRKSETMQVAVSAKMAAMERKGLDGDPILAYKLVAKEFGLSQPTQPKASDVPSQRTEAQTADSERSTSSSVDINKVNEQLKNPDLSKAERDRLLMKRMELRRSAQTA